MQSSKQCLAFINQALFCSFKRLTKMSYTVYAISKYRWPTFYLPKVYFPSTTAEKQLFLGENGLCSSYLHQFFRQWEGFAGQLFPLQLDWTTILAILVGYTNIFWWPIAVLSQWRIPDVWNDDSQNEKDWKWSNVFPADLQNIKCKWIFNSSCIMK